MQIVACIFLLLQCTSGFRVGSFRHSRIQKSRGISHIDEIATPALNGISHKSSGVEVLSPMNPSTDFQYLKKLDARVKRLSDGESDYLLSFWSDSLKCFQIYPNLNTTRVSVTTTCMTISAILANPAHWERSCRWAEVVGTSGRDGIGGVL